MESAKRAASLLQELKNKAEAAARTGVAPKDSVSAATISQLEGLVMRLKGEAKSALSAASHLPTTPARPSSSRGRSRSQAAARSPSPGARSVRSSRDSAGPGSVSGSTHRQRLHRIQSRVDTGQRTTTPGLSRIGKKIRRDAARASQDRQLKSASLRGRSKSAHSPDKRPSPGRAAFDELFDSPERQAAPLPEPVTPPKKQSPAVERSPSPVPEVKEDSPLAAAVSEWQVWIETPTPGGGSGPSVYYYRASDRVVQWDRPHGPNILVMTRSEAAQRAAQSLETSA